MKPSPTLRNPAFAHFVCDFTRWAGLGVGAYGLLAVVSWHAHWRPFLQILPGTKPIQYNTALCFIVAGMGLQLLNAGRERIAAWCGIVMAGFAGVNTLQYLTGLDVGVDQLFLKPYFEAGFSHPGRISALGSVCFILSGCGIFLAGTKNRTPARLTAAGLAACVVSVIAFLALLGYAFQITAAYNWGGKSPMALITAGLFLWLNIGLLSWTFQKAQAENLNFRRWLPVAASATLMAMIVFVSLMNMRELKQATFWRKHTFEVILGAQSFEETLIDLQRGMRGYVISGDTNALASYRESLQLEPEKFSKIQTLTHDNPGQQQQLQLLAAAMRAVIAYDERMIALRDRHGADALDTASDTEGRRVFGSARDNVKSLFQEEQGLLMQRDGLEQADSNNAERLMIFGSIVAAILLVFANTMASRELQHRRRVEVELLEISTLQDAILNSSQYAIIALRPDGVVSTFNPAAERMLGYSAEEIVGKETPMLWRDKEEVVQAAEALSSELGRTVKPGIEIITANPLAIRADEYEVTYVHKNGKRFPVQVSLTALMDKAGSITGFLGVIADITERKHYESEREKMIFELQAVIAQVKTLSGMIPICGWCKSVRSDQGYWQTVEQYMRAHTDATFSHGMCPACVEKFKSDILNFSAKEPVSAKA